MEDKDYNKYIFLTSKLDDIFLTKNPEITHFYSKIKRHTNFSNQFLEIDFQTEPAFSNSCICQIPKNNSDLIHHCILKITLPFVSLTRITDPGSIAIALNIYNTAITNLNNLQLYTTIILGAYSLLLSLQNSTDLTALILYTNTLNYFNNTINVTNYNNLVSILPSLITSNSNIKDIVTTIFNEITTNNEKISKIYSQIESIKVFLINQVKLYFNSYLSTKSIYLDVSNTNYNFSWIDNIGAFIFKHIDLKISDQLYDSYTNDFFYINNQLYINKTKQLLYNKMIGTNQSINIYDRIAKNSYVLYIPLIFNFNNYIQKNFPIVCTRYNDINLTVHFNDLIRCIKSDYNNSNNDIQNLIKLSNISLICEYIQLSKDEKYNLSISNFVSVFEQLQYTEFTNLTSSKFTLNLNNIVNPIKDIYFVIQHNISNNIHNLTTNYYLSNYNLLDISNPTLTGDIIKFVTFQVNNMQLPNNIDNYNNTYLNYVIPYERYFNYINQGIYVYSFSLFPLEHNPSGSCNFSRLNNFSITFELNNNFVITGSFNVKVFFKNYNVLHFNKGFCTILF